MFISLCKKIKQQLKAKKAWRQVLAYGILAFLIMQCYVLPFASENTEAWESVATIGDATWTNALPQDIQADAEESAFTESEETVQSVSPSAYYQAPDTSNAFVAYAMTIPKGSGKNSDNMCAIYVAQALSGFYGDKASVQGSTLVSQISDTLEVSENWERVYADANCFPKDKTEAEYDAIYDQLTNAGDVICFVNGKLDGYVHCAISGGGTALIGHLYSSGWDSLRACYYLDNAVDVRKQCSGMIVYRPKERLKTGTLRICKSYNEDVYKTNPKLYDVAGANYAVYASYEDAKRSRNVKGYCYIEPGENGALAEDNVSCSARTKPDEQGTIVQVAEGTYYIREWNVPTNGGWKLDPNIYSTKIYAGRRTTLGLPRDAAAKPLELKSEGDYFDTRVVGPEEEYLGKLRLTKKVEENYEAFLLEHPEYSFDGIEYAVYAVSANGSKDTTKRVGLFRMDKKGTGFVQECAHDTDCVGDTEMQLRIGWYMIQEEKANDYMLLDDTPVWVQIKKDQTTPMEVVVKDAVNILHFRGDLSFTKVDENGTPLANIAFSISDTKGESHIVWTDENGYYSTAASYIPHSYHTNQEEAGAGIWFGQADVDDTKGALPYGTYYIEEVRCEANKNKYRNAEKIEVSIQEDGAHVELGTIINELFPQIKTKAGFENPIVDIRAKGTLVPCKDIVSFENLEIGHTYTISGEARWKKDGTVLEKPYMAKNEPVTFVAEKVNMDIEVKYEILFLDALCGQEVVFYETVKDTAYPGEIVASHTDLSDLAQTICFPEEPSTTTTETTETTETSETSETTVAGTSTQVIPTKEQAVKTGDEANLFLTILVLCTSAVGIGMGLIGRKRSHKQK